MTKFQGNRVRNDEVIWVLREAYRASFISIKSPQRELAAHTLSANEKRHTVIPHLADTLLLQTPH